jgi:hypothetical protein
MPQENRRCGDCRFAENIRSDTQQRQCRRTAPTNGSSIGQWPRVLLSDWCYEFEAVRGSGGVQTSTSRSSIAATDGVVKRTAAESWDEVIAEMNNRTQSPPAGRAQP